MWSRTVPLALTLWGSRQDLQGLVYFIDLYPPKNGRVLSESLPKTGCPLHNAQLKRTERKLFAERKSESMGATTYLDRIMGV